MSVFPKSQVIIAPLQDIHTSSLVDIRPAVAQLVQQTDPRAQYRALISIIGRIQQAIDNLQQVLRTVSPTVTTFKIDPSDITGYPSATAPLTADSGGTGFATYAKGDLLVGNGAHVLVALTVGANGKMIIADSTQTGGVRWDSRTIFTLADISIRANNAAAVAAGLAVGQLYRTGADPDVLCIVH